MSNNNSRNIYNKVSHGTDDEEMEILINSSTTPQQTIRNNQMTTITIENDISPSTSNHHLLRQQSSPQIRREVEATRISMERDGVNLQTANGGRGFNLDGRQRMPSLFTMLRRQLSLPQSPRDPHPNGRNLPVITHSRTWREDLYEVLSSPDATSREHSNVLRAIFTPPSAANIRYDTMHANVLLTGDQLHFVVNRQNSNQNEEPLQSSLRSEHGTILENESSAVLGLSRQNSYLAVDRSLNENSTSDQQTPVIDLSTENVGGINETNRRQSFSNNSAANGRRTPQRSTSLAESTTAAADDAIEDTDTDTAAGEIILQIVTHFIRYLPFIFIIFVKFIHDHLLGILDILVLYGLVYLTNKSIKKQAAKHNHKSLLVLMINLFFVVVVIAFRFHVSTSNPDPWGLLINPPDVNIPIEKLQTSIIPINSVVKSEREIYEVPSSATTDPLISTIDMDVTTTISLGALLYYVAVNDLILKLLTQLIKIVLTMFPTKIIRHKFRARLYALIEGTSQFYRALAPINQWLKFLFGSYTGFEMISGTLFASFYCGAKLFELYQRGKQLKKSIINIARNATDERKPTKDELEAAGTTCPICRDLYSSPVVLECGHIFCDECVNTWFEREQTCPLCRASVSEDPAWQDGSTTYFCQLF